MLSEISSSVRWSTITALELVHTAISYAGTAASPLMDASIGMYSLAYTACLQSACCYAVDNTANGDMLGTVSRGLHVCLTAIMTILDAFVAGKPQKLQVILNVFDSAPLPT